MVDDAGDHEQRGFEGGVVQHMEHRAHGGQRRTQPNEKSDQAQVTHCRISEQALEVVFEDGNERGKGDSDKPCGGDDSHKQLGAADDRGEGFLPNLRKRE